MTTAFFNAVRTNLSGEFLQEILALRNTCLEKEDGSYVTKGDLLVQNMILQAAHMHLESPCIVSEEIKQSGYLSPEGRLLVVIDPIDGTENFASGLPEWGVSISVYYNGIHVGSLIGSPELRLWLQTGEKIIRYNSRIRALSSSLTKQQILASTTGYEYRILGCCVINMIHVIRGSFFSFENPKGAWSWDILAGINLAIEHGLDVRVADIKYTGEYLPPTHRFRFKIEASL